MRATRFGLVGFAGLGSQDHQSAMYLPALRDRSDVVVPAVAAVGPADLAAATSAARDLDISPEPDVDTLLKREDLDAVVVCAPPELRGDLVCAAARSGRHVLADKPLALSARDVARICAAANETGAIVAVAQHLRHSGLLSPLVGALRAGRVGLPSTVQADFVVAGGTPVPGLELANLGIYPIDLIQHMTAQTPLRVHAVRADRDGRQGFIVMVDYDNGVHATAMVARTCELLGADPSAPVVHRYRIAGSLGTVSADLTRPGVEVLSSTKRSRSWVGPSTVSACIEDFLTAVRTGGTPICGPADALVGAAIIDAARHSLETGQPAEVQIPVEER